MSFWYLGSPYSKYPGGIELAYKAAVEARGLLVRGGVQCFSPIVHSHPIAMGCGMDPYDHSIWVPDHRPFINAAMGLIVLRIAGWQESVGLAEEIMLFKTANKPIVDMDPGWFPFTTPD